MLGSNHTNLIYIWSMSSSPFKIFCIMTILAICSQVSHFYLVKNPKSTVGVLKSTKKIMDPTGTMGVRLDLHDSTEKMQPLRKFLMAMCGLQMSGIEFVFWQVLQGCNSRSI